MAQRHVRIHQYVDVKTGEIQPFIVIDIQEKDKDFVKVKQALTKTVLERLKYINGAAKLLFLLLDIAIESRIFERPVDIYLTPEMAQEKIGLSRMTFYRHINLLMQSQIIFKLRPHVYRLNPEMVWMGDLKSYVKWLKEQNKEEEIKEPKKRGVRR